MKPVFEHDCERCLFLGSILVAGHACDLYYCPNEPTIIARFSSEASDYASGISFGESGLVRMLNGQLLGNNALAVAYVLALANGLDVKERGSIHENYSLPQRIISYKPE